MTTKNKDSGHKSLKNSNRSFSSANVDLNDDNTRMRANFEANPFKFVNGNGVLLKEQVVGEDGEVYESEEDKEESEIEHQRQEYFNTTWSNTVGDTISESIQNGFGNDANDYVRIQEIEQEIDAYDYGMMARYGRNPDDSPEIFDLGQVPVEDLLHVDYDQAMQAAIDNGPNAFSPFGTFGGSPITSPLSPTASFNDVAGVPLTGENTLGNNTFGAPAANDPSFNDLLKDDPLNATPTATAPPAAAAAPAPK